MTKSTAKSLRAFTLVELAIVLVIIGLIVGGILVGEEIRSAARLHRVINEFEQFHSQTYLFVERYRYLPGDFPNALATFTGCSDNGNNQCNGNGNGVIGENTAPYYGEACRYWQHLKLAGWLQEQALVYQGQNAGSCSPLEVPKSSYSEIASWHMAMGDTQTDFPNHVQGVNYFVFRKGSMYGRTMHGSGGALVSPAFANAIDVKIDDGKPLIGRVIADNDLGSGLASAPYAPQSRYCLYGSGAVDTWTYYLTYQGEGACMMAFRAKF